MSKTTAAVNAVDLSVEQLGRRARERLKEEQSKRREIVRISQEQLPTNPLPSPTDKEQRSGQPARPRDGAQRKRRRSVTRPSVTDENQVDRWLPGLSAVQIGSDETRSRVVRLHGIPKGTHPGHLRRFFSGLDPERILLLPPFAEHIQGWDSDHSVPHKSGKRVERYPPTLRVMVQFASAPTAEAAARRSAEVLKGAVVAVTVVPKPIASYVLKHMVVDAPSGRALDESLEEVAAKLDPLVPKTLWEAAFRDHDVKSSRAGAVQIGLPLPTSDDEALVVKSRCAELQEAMDRLGNNLSFVVARLDPQLAARDPVKRLTINAVGLMEREKNTLERKLHKARTLKLLLRP